MKNTFKIEKDDDGREYIVQVIKEFDKNHREDDMSTSNDARIYTNPDKYCTLFVTPISDPCDLLV